MSNNFDFDLNTFKAAQIGEAINQVIYNTLYEDPDAGIREIIANAYDAYNDRKYVLHDKKGLVIIEIDTEKKVLRFIDYATGIIVHVEEFKLISYNTPDQAKSAESVGENHIGKSSAMKLCSRSSSNVPMVVFRSNNGIEGRVIPMVFANNKIGYLEGYRYEQNLISQAKSEIGLTIEVRDVIEDMLKPKEIARIVAKFFGILIKRKLLRVLIHDIHAHTELEVAAPAELKTDREVKKTPYCQTSQYGWISNHLDHQLKPRALNIDIYHKYVYVKSIKVDFCCEGWINCDDFRLNLAKDGFLTGPGTAYTEGMKNFQEKYCPGFFERQHYKETKITHEKDMTKLYSNLLNAALPTFAKQMTDLAGLAEKNAIIQGIPKQQSTIQGQLQVLPNQTLTDNTGSGNGNPVIPFGPGHRRGGGRRDGTGNKPGIQPGGNHDVLIPKQQEQQQPPQHTKIKADPKIIKGNLGPNLPECWVNDKWELVMNLDRPSIQHILVMPKLQRLATLTMPFVAAIVEAFTKEKSRPVTVGEYRNLCSDIFSRSFSGQTN